MRGMIYYESKNSKSWPYNHTWMVKIKSYLKVTWLFKKITLLYILILTINIKPNGQDLLLLFSRNYSLLSLDPLPYLFICLGPDLECISIHPL